MISFSSYLAFLGSRNFIRVKYCCPPLAVIFTKPISVDFLSKTEKLLPQLIQFLLHLGVHPEESGLDRQAGHGRAGRGGCCCV